MLFAELLVTLPLLAVCSFAQGFFFVRRFRWSGLEKLCGSVALSLILLWLAAWGVYVLAPSLQQGAYVGIVAICCAAAVFTWREALALFRQPRVRRALAGYGFLLAWTLLILSIIRVYTGAFWIGDWMEHFQRALFFLHHFPSGTPIYGAYQLPARPPMMNVLASLFLSVTEDRFEIFQVVFTFFNLLVFLPCCLAIPVVARVRRVRVLPLAAIIAMNPSAMQNATYTWTKSLTAFFVIFAICLYLSGWRKRDSVRMTCAFLALAAGLLVHYSAGPYCVFFALHYLIVVFRTRPNKWVELSSIAAGSAVLLLTWFGWSLATYGVKSTSASNSTFILAKTYHGTLLAKISGNLFDSFVPVILHDSAKLQLYSQPYRPAVLRDATFGIYQTNVILMMGLVGGPLVVWFLIQAFRSGKRGGERSFWLWLIGFSVIVGIATTGERDEFGVGHLTLVPMEMLGLTLLSSQFYKKRAIAFAILTGCAVDFGLGVFLHARVQHLDNTEAHTYYTGLGIRSGQFRAGMFGPDSVGHTAWRNWFNKRQSLLAREWLMASERYHPGDPTLAATRAAFRSAMTGGLAEDEMFWHGWFARHGGEMVYLGDWLGDSDVPSALLLLTAAGLLVMLARPEPVRAVSAVSAVKAKAAPSRRKRS